MKPKVSVIIPTYNKVDLLRVTLESLSRQDLSPSAFEVIVVDDGSSDGTRDFLESVRLKAQPEGLKSDLRIRYVLHDANRGRAAARNTGVARAEGELVVFLDDDMVAVPGFLRAHICCHDEADSMDPSTGRAVIGNVMPGKQVPRDCLNRYLVTRGVHKLLPGEEVPFRYFVTNNSSLRRSDLIRAGLFDERLVAWGGEDLELGYRLRKMGLEFVYCPSAVSYHTHFRTLEEVCRLSETFGEQSVPILVCKCPALRSTLWLDFEQPKSKIKVKSEKIKGEKGIFSFLFYLLSFFLSSLSRDTLRKDLKKVLLRMAMRDYVYRVAKALASLFNRIYVPMWVFDYLLLYTRYRGFQKSKIKVKSKKIKGAGRGLLSFIFYLLSFFLCLFILFLSNCGGPPGGGMPGEGEGRRSEQERALSFRFLLSFGAHGSGPGAFVDPYGISVDRLGRVYVADTGNDRIQKFDGDGRFLDEIGGFGWDADQFNRPTDVYVRDGLEIYVADAGNRRIQRFDSRFDLLESITHFEDQEFGDLMSVAVSPTGDLYVTDLHRDEVLRLSPFSGEGRVFGGLETGGSGWLRPWGVAVNGEEAVYISDTGNARILRFDPFGNLLAVWGQGILGNPAGMAVDRWGRLFVADAGEHQVLVFGRRGNLLGRLGAEGEGFGAFREPRDVALGPGEMLYVLDSGNARVQKFRVESK